eukprot:SAG25_NODE_545_length_7036_cov_4.224593_4_plen_84_part_00
MGKGLPGGRRQAGRIDYWIEPNSSLLPDRPRAARPPAVGLAGCMMLLPWRACVGVNAGVLVCLGGMAAPGVAARVHAVMCSVA